MARSERQPAVLDILKGQSFLVRIELSASAKAFSFAKAAMAVKPVQYREAAK
jgi:hypothetical protein